MAGMHLIQLYRIAYKTTSVPGHEHFSLRYKSGRIDSYDVIVPFRQLFS